MIDVEKMKKDLLGTDPTLYCSVIAHLKGKLHMKKINGSTIWAVTGKCCWSWFGWNNKECLADERRHMFHWGVKDQAKLVEETINKYKIEESVEAAVA